MSKVYGYVIINKETGEQYGRQVYNRKNGAANSYNQQFRYRAVDESLKFQNQDVFILRELVIKDE